MKNTLLVLIGVFLFMAGCSEDIEDGPVRNIEDCDYDKIDDWDEQRTLSWDDPLPVESTEFSNFRALWERVEGEYAVHYGGQHGVLTISRDGQRTPYQRHNIVYCTTSWHLPIKLKLADGDKVWTAQDRPLIASEIVGVVSDREIPEGKLYPSLDTLQLYEMNDSFPSFNAEDDLPEVKEGEMRVGRGAVETNIFWDGRVILNISVTETLTKNGVSGYESKPWFTLEGEKVE